MVTLLMPCILVLLDKEGATIRDLQRFMDAMGKRNSDLIAFAKTRTRYPDICRFF